MSRALRRHYLEREKRRVVDYYGGYMRTLSESERARHVGIHAQSQKSCSCYCCGNPRRHFGERTVQERRMGVL